MALRRRWPTRAFAVAVAIGLTLVACTDDDDDAGTTTTEESTTTSESTTTTAEATTTTLSPEDQVVHDYQAAIAGFSAAGNPPTPEHPELVRLWIGEALSEAQSMIRQLQLQGVGAQNTIETHPVVVSVSGDVAMIDDCFVDHTQFINLETGQPVGEAGTTTVNGGVRLERSDGLWKIAERTRREDPCSPS